MDTREQEILKRALENSKKRKEIKECKEWLTDNDYIVNKHTLGELSDTDIKWVNYLSSRYSKIARIKELENQLEGTVVLR